MQSVAIAQVHLQYFLSSQITHKNILLHVFENITITAVFILMLIFWNNINWTKIHYIYSKETSENAARKQTLLENVNVSCRVFLQVTQFYVYAVMLSSEVKMFCH